MQAQARGGQRAHRGMVAVPGQSTLKPAASAGLPCRLIKKQPTYLKRHHFRSHMKIYQRAKQKFSFLLVLLKIELRIPCSGIILLSDVQLVNDS